MAVEIGRSFSELDKKIKETKGEIKSAQNAVKGFDKDLRLNPGDVEAVRGRFAAIEKQLTATAKKEEQLKQMQDALVVALKNNEISEKSYAKQLAEVNKQLKTTEEQTKQLTEELEKQQSALDTAKLAKFTQALDKAEQKTRKLSGASRIALNAIVSLVKGAIELGDELNDTAAKYQTSVEQLQVWQNRLGMLAADQQAYVSSLQTVGSMLTSIAAGRGQRYLNFLQQIGIAQDDLKGKTNAEVFDMIYEGLRTVSSEADRTIIAQGLLGDKGLEIAQIAATEKTEIDKLDQALLENGVITTEQAKAADQAANKLLGAKQQASALGAEFLMSLLPILGTLVKMLKSLLGWIGNLGEGGQRALVVVLAFVVILPKIITLIRTASAAITVLNTASTPWLGIITAISLVLLGLITLLGIFNDTAQETVASTQQMLDSIGATQDAIDGMGGNVTYSAATESTKKTSYDLNVNVAATGTGEAVNDEAAEKIADSLRDKLMVDLVNQGLGSIIR